MSKSTRGRRFAGLAVTALAAAAGLAAPGAAEAALVFQSDQPVYAASGDGVVTAAVKIYLIQTGRTTTLSDGGGPNSAGLRVVAVGPPARPVRLLSIAANPAFDTVTTDLATGSLYEEFASLSAGLPPEPGDADRYLLGTYTFGGQAAGGLAAMPTSFAITPRNGSAGSDTYAADGDGPFDAAIESGSFVVVPEPSAAAATAAVGLGAVALRRARRTPARSR